MSRVNDRIKGGMSRIADRATPSPDAWESVVDRISRQPEHEEMEVIMLQKNPLPTRRLGLWAASAAAVVAAIAFVGIVLVDDDSDQTTVTAPPTTESPTTAVPATTVPEVDPALEIAEQFMAARQAHDADGVMSLVATGASIALRTEWITDPGEYRQLVAYEEAVGFEFNDVTCSAGSEGRVTCVYSLETRVTKAADVGAFNASFLFEIEDGLITAVTHRRNNDGAGRFTYYSRTFFENFNLWQALNHPDDFDTLWIPSDPNNIHPPRLTDEAIALWAERVADYENR